MELRLKNIHCRHISVNIFNKSKYICSIRIITVGRQHDQVLSSKISILVLFKITQVTFDAIKSLLYQWINTSTALLLWQAVKCVCEGGWGVLCFKATTMCFHLCVSWGVNARIAWDSFQERAAQSDYIVILKIFSSSKTLNIVTGSRIPLGRRRWRVCGGWGYRWEPDKYTNSCYSSNTCPSLV